MKVFASILLLALLAGGLSLAQMGEPLAVQEVDVDLIPAFVPDVPEGTVIVLLEPDLVTVRLQVTAQNDPRLPLLLQLLESRRLQGTFPVALLFPRGSPIGVVFLPEISVDLLRQFTLRDLIIARIGMENYQRLVPSGGNLQPPPSP